VQRTSEDRNKQSLENTQTSWKKDQNKDGDYVKRNLERVSTNGVEVY